METFIQKKGISVSELAQNPEINLKDYGCWISQSMDGNFRRIACVELLEYDMFEEYEFADSIILKDTFSTMRFMLEELARQNKKVTSIALPVLGTGNQGKDR